MVPLNGGKNIGEVALGDLSGRASIPFGSLHYWRFKGRLEWDK